MSALTVHTNIMDIRSFAAKYGMVFLVVSVILSILLAASLLLGGGYMRPGRPAQGMPGAGEGRQCRQGNANLEEREMRAAGRIPQETGATE